MESALQQVTAPVSEHPVKRGSMCFKELSQDWA